MAVISHLPHVLANVLMEHAGGFNGRRQAGPALGGAELHGPHPRGRSQPAHVARHLLENREALSESLRAVSAELDEFRRTYLEPSDEAGIAESIDSAAAYREEMLEYEDLTPETLYTVTVRVPDQPGSISPVMTALGRGGHQRRRPHAAPREPQRRRRPGAVHRRQRGRRDAGDPAQRTRLSLRGQLHGRWR